MCFLWVLRSQEIHVRASLNKQTEKYHQIILFFFHFVKSKFFFFFKKFPRQKISTDVVTISPNKTVFTFARTRWIFFPFHASDRERAPPSLNSNEKKRANETFISFPLHLTCFFFLQLSRFHYH